MVGIKLLSFYYFREYRFMIMHNYNIKYGPFSNIMFKWIHIILEFLRNQKLYLAVPNTQNYPSLWMLPRYHQKSCTRTRVIAQCLMCFQCMWLTNTSSIPAIPFGRPNLQGVILRAEPEVSHEHCGIWKK